MDAATLQRLTAHIRDPDLRQDTIVSLLVMEPATEDDAEVIIRRSRYAAENHRRRRPRQLAERGEWLTADVETDSRTATLQDAADALPADDRDLYDRLRAGWSQADIATSLGITRQAVNQRHRKLIHALTR